MITQCGCGEIVISQGTGRSYCPDCRPRARRYPGRPAGWAPCAPWVAKGHAWAPAPPDLRGTPAGTGGYWLAIRQGAHVSGGFQTRAAAREYIAAQSDAWVTADPGGVRITRRRAASQ